MSSAPPSFDALFLELNNAQENARRDAASLKLAKKEENDLRLQFSNLRDFFENELTAKQLVQVRENFVQSKNLLFDFTQEVDALEKYRNQLILNVETKVKNRLSEINNGNKKISNNNDNNNNSNSNCLCSQHKDFLIPSSSSNSYFSLMMNEDHLKKVFDLFYSSAPAVTSSISNDDAAASKNDNISSTPTFDVDEAIAQEEKYLQNAEHDQNHKKGTQKIMPVKRNKNNSSKKNKNENNFNDNNNDEQKLFHNQNNDAVDDDDDEDDFDLVKFYSGNNNLNNSLNVAVTTVAPLRQIGEGNFNNAPVKTNIIMNPINQNNKNNSNINNSFLHQAVAPPPRATKWVPPNKNKTEEREHDQEMKHNNNNNQASVIVGPSTSRANVTGGTSTKSFAVSNSASSKPITTTSTKQQNCRFFNHQDDDFGNSWV